MKISFGTTDQHIPYKVKYCKQGGYMAKIALCLKPPSPKSICTYFAKIIIEHLPKITDPS